MGESLNVLEKPIEVYDTSSGFVSELREGVEFVTESGCLRSVEGMEALS